MKKRWEIIVFTASHQSYADTILDEIDPDRTLFDHRLYRQHCRELTTELYVKDLSKLNRDLSQTVLVDNSAYSYAMQLDNGIPILPFYEGKDFELAALESYLQKLLDCDDVRTLNRQYFQLNKYTSYDNSHDLVDELYRQKFS
jgi:CTD small phosphatase-like protein 2